MKKRNNWNAQKDEPFYEKNSGILMTEPGQSYTVRDLVIRYQNGVPLPRVNMLYDEIFEEEPNPMRRPDFDLTDIDEANNFINEQSDIVKQKLKIKDHEKSRLENDHQSDHNSVNSSDSSTPNGEG